MKSKIVAALLAFFLGGFGIHRFYLGQVGRGFVYILFCWTLIPALVAFVEFILFLTMDEDRFDRIYNGVDRHAGASVVLNGGGYGRASSTADEIEKLHHLMAKGVISEREFEERKARIL